MVPPKIVPILYWAFVILAFASEAGGLLTSLNERFGNVKNTFSFKINI